MSTVRADDILRAVARYCHDQNCWFTTRCRSGPTEASVNGIQERWFEFDGLAVARSWTRFAITIFEVKVDRWDFLRDVKWPEYRAFCHRLYIVCPEKLVAKDELPPDVGLMYYRPQTETLRTARAAAHRQIDVSWELLAHIIMSHLDPDRHPFFTDAREFWRRWAEHGKLDRDLACRVRGRMKKVLWEAAEASEKLQAERRTLQKAARCWEKVDRILREYGLHVWLDDAGVLWDEKRLRQRLRGEINPDIRLLVERLAEDVETLQRITRLPEEREAAASR